MKKKESVKKQPTKVIDFFTSMQKPFNDQRVSQSVSQFSHSVMSDSLGPHGLQYTRPPYPSPTPRVYSNSCPVSQWCHPIISSFLVPFCSHLQSFPASGSFQMSQFFTSGGQSIAVPASASVLPMNIQENKVCHCFHCFPISAMKGWNQMPWS